MDSRAISQNHSESDDMTSTVIDFLLARKSPPIADLKEPGPSDEEIATILKVATRVPDHGKLAPWRFILYRGDSRIRAGELLARRAAELEGPLSEGRLEQERTRFSRAPLVVGVVHVPKDHPKVPKWEMFLSGGAAAMKLVLAANALGYGTNWVTNWYSEDAEGRRILGLAPDERVIGFVHVGTPTNDVPERPRPDVARLVTDYSGPLEG